MVMAPAQVLDYVVAHEVAGDLGQPLAGGRERQRPLRLFHVFPVFLEHFRFT